LAREAGGRLGNSRAKQGQSAPGWRVAGIVEADVDLVGKIVQFGRGMIDEVSRQLFRQFSACVKQHLEVEESALSEEPRAADTKAVSATALGFRAIWAIIVRFFGRLFGKQVS
jgi:hypothetical protein